MTVEQTRFPDVKLIRPKVFRDERGYFLELFRTERYREFGIDGDFVQDNLSFSKRGTIRGLHFQYPTLQGKLITVLAGEVFDVVVDIRTGSPTFGQWLGIELLDTDHAQLWVPEGFAHGFYVVSESAVLQYKCRGPYAPKEEKTLLWSDEAVGVQWPGPLLMMSSKDRIGRSLEDLMRQRELPQFGGPQGVD